MRHYFYFTFHYVNLSCALTCEKKIISHQIELLPCDKAFFWRTVKCHAPNNFFILHIFLTYRKKFIAKNKMCVYKM